MKYFNFIKEKIIVVLWFLLSVAGLAIGYYKARNSDLKRKAVEQELEDEKAATEQANRSTEAVIRGMSDEQETDNPRAYKFGD